MYDISEPTHRGHNIKVTTRPIHDVAVGHASTHPGHDIRATTHVGHDIGIGHVDVV